MKNETKPQRIALSQQVLVTLVVRVVFKK